MAGEGETTFRELLGWYHGEGSLAEIKGLVYRDEAGKFCPHRRAGV